MGEFAAVASVRVGCGYGDGGELIVGVLQAGVRELGGLGCFGGGADAAGDVFEGDVMVTLVVMVPSSLG